MSKKTRKLKAKIDILRSDINYHKSNVRLLLNKPTEVQIEELKFQYGDFNYNLVAGRQPSNTETIRTGKITVPTGYGKGEFMENVDLHKDFLGLPWHWYIQVTKDNKEILTDYLKNHKQRYEQFSEHWYAQYEDDEVCFFHSDSKQAAHSDTEPWNGYTEVTTEMVENYMKKWHQIQSFNLVDKSWLEVKKEAARKEAEKLTKQTDVNKDANGWKVFNVDGVLINFPGDKYNQNGWDSFLKALGNLPVCIPDDPAFTIHNTDECGEIRVADFHPFAITPENLTPISKHVMDITEEDKKQKTIKYFFSLLKGDPDYLRSWKDNIAMAFQDNYKWAQDSGEINIHKIANDSANYFFGTLFRQPSDVIEVAEKLYYYMNPGTKMDVPSSAFEITEKWHGEWQNGWKESDPEESFFDWCIKNKMPNKEGATGNTTVYSPEHLEAKNKLFASNNVNKDGEVTIKIIDDYTEADKLIKEQIEKYDDFFKSHTGHSIEAGTHKAPDEYVLVKVKVGSLIIENPGDKCNFVAKSSGIDHVGVGDLKKRADAMEKCTDQECKPIKQQYEKTLENVTKIYAFIGLREKNSISKGNKDIIFMKTNNYNGGVGYFNTKEPNLMYSPSEMLSDWKSNYVKPLD
ncbi:MAG: hypothetical protein KA270_02845 [Saprospiraceae bacterium]|nr:hypothetical protein [Saprospiraceae bacterium]